MRANYWIILLPLFLLLISYPAIGQTLLPGSGNCLNLAGVNGYINAGQQNRGITNTVTVEAWIKTKNFNYTWIAGKYSNSLGEDGGYHLYLIDGKVGFNGRDGSGNYRSSGLSTTIVTDNNWHHVAGVCNKGRWEVWVDGILESVLNTGYSATDLTTAQAYLTIGNYYDYNSNYFSGNLDEVRIWKTARTVEQLRANMCRKLPLTTDASLVAYFKFDEINTTTFRDFSQSKAGGQLINAVSNTALITSGAPIGDESLGVYQTSWTSSELAMYGPANHTFQINDIASNTQGIHLYRVSSLPNSSKGITSNTTPNFYFGVFTVSPDRAATYTVSYTTEPTDKCLPLYGREDNAQLQWNLRITTRKVNSLVKSNENYRGEYILNYANLSVVSISGNAEICSGAFTVLQTNATGISKYLWNTGETTSSIQVNKAGTYSVKAFATDQCFTEDSITVNAITLAPVNIAGESVICPDSTLVLQANITNSARFLWNTGETASRIQVSKPGTYSVKAFITDQCYTEASITIIPRITEDCTIPDKNVFIPNIITPNGDNLNETFYIKNMELHRWQLKIFNRWGKLIYLSNKYANDWSAKDVSDGIFYYILNAPDNIKSYKGYLEVIK